MTYIAKFKIDNAFEFDVSENGAISLGPDFVPPGVSPAYNIAAGTSANATGGGVLVGTKYQDREWSFSLKITAATEAFALILARRVAAFLSRPGVKTFEWSGTGLPAPLWGQFGAPIIYEIIGAGVSVDQMYSLDPRRGNYNLPVSLMVKPFAKGRKQRAASGIGGLILTNLGSADGSSWGLRVAPATTNKMTDPVFGSAGGITNWTAAANIIASQCTDPSKLFPGSFSSALLTSRGSTNNTFTQSINAGNTNGHSFSFLCYRPDGAAVTASDVQVYYQSARSTTFQSLGNGLYLGYCDNISGINSAQPTGVIVYTMRSIYLLAYQMEEKSLHTPFCMGDMLGCSWATTAHGSTSTRVAGRVRIPVAQDTFNHNLFAIHLIWKTDFANTAAGDRYLFSCGSSSIRCYFQASDDTFIFTDNANTAATSNATFVAGDVIEILCTAGNSGLVVYYRNHRTGVTMSGTQGSFTIPAAPSYIYIGSDDSAANHCGGVIQLFETYNDDLTSAQNTTLQTAAAPICSAGLRVGDIPWIWTKDGDDVVDNCDDSTHDNWIAVGGIPGDAPALTEITADPGASFSTACHFWRYDTAYFVNPGGFFSDLSGDADAGCCGGQYDTSAGGATELGTFTLGTIPARELFGRDIWVLTRVKVATAGNIDFNATFTLGGSADIVSILSPLYASSDAAFWLYRVGPVRLPDTNSAVYKQYVSSGVSVTLTLDDGKNSTAGNKYIDYMEIALGDIAYFTPTTTATFVIDGPEAVAGAGVMIPLIGKVIEFVPGRYNCLVSAAGAMAGASVITETITYTVYVTPRWSLL